MNVDGVRIEDNGFSGINVNDATQLNVSNTVIAGNGQEGVSLGTTASTP